MLQRAGFRMELDRYHEDVKNLAGHSKSECSMPNMYQRIFSTAGRRVVHATDLCAGHES